MRRNNTVYLLTTISLMIAIQFIFGFTPIGTISTGALTITLMGIPLAIMCCTYGPIMGTIGGLVWGIISIIQAFCGMDATGTLILNAEDITWSTKISGLIVMCVVARMLAGFLGGFFYDLVRHYDKRGLLSSFVASASVSLFNTFFFMTFFCLFFYNTETIKSLCESAGYSATNPFLFVIAIIGINFIVELLVNAIAGTALSFGLSKIEEKIDFRNPFPRIFRPKTEETAQTEEK